MIKNKNMKMLMVRGRMNEGKVKEVKSRVGILKAKWWGSGRQG